MNKINNNLQLAYDEQYSEKMNGWRLMGAKQKVENILSLVGDLQFSKVLEVGAGNGSILTLLSKKWKFSEFYALEISSSGIDQIKSKPIDNLASVQKFDGYTIPFPDKYFDLVILSHVLEHVEHERILLREIKRVSKNFLIEVPKDYRFGVDNKVEHFLSYGHINLYTPSSLRFLLKSEGFIIEKSQTNLYSIDSYLWNKTGISKLLAYIIFTFKKLLINIPVKYISDRFVNTISILSNCSGKELNIM